MGHTLHHQGLDARRGDAPPERATGAGRRERATRSSSGASTRTSPTGSSPPRRAVFERGGAEAVDVFDVPGAYELPLAAQEIAKTGRYAGVACLGAVIRGETSHYDYVCGESARGIMDVSSRPACRARSAS